LYFKNKNVMLSKWYYKLSLYIYAFH
jgi:hypothetical protein